MSKNDLTKEELIKEVELLNAKLDTAMQYLEVILSRTSEHEALVYVNNYKNEKSRQQIKKV